MKRLILLAALALAGCSTLTPDQEMRITCRAGTSTIRILTPLKPKMSAEQIRAVDGAIDVLQPACHDAERGVLTTTSILQRAQDALNSIVRAESEVSK